MAAVTLFECCCSQARVLLLLTLVGCVHSCLVHNALCEAQTVEGALVFSPAVARPCVSAVKVVVLAENVVFVPPNDCSHVGHATITDF